MSRSFSFGGKESNEKSVRYINRRMHVVVPNRSLHRGNSGSRNRRDRPVSESPFGEIGPESWASQPPPPTSASVGIKPSTESERKETSKSLRENFLSRYNA